MIPESSSFPGVHISVSDTLFTETFEFFCCHLYFSAFIPLLQSVITLDRI